MLQLRRPRLPRRFTTLLFPICIFLLLYFLPLNRRSDIVFEDVEEALHIPHVHHTFDEISPPVKPAPIVVAPPLGEAVTPARPVRPVIPAVAPPFIAPMVPKAPVVAPRPPPIAPVAPVIPVIAAAPARPPKAAAAPAREAKFKREENGLMIVPLEEVGVGKHPIEVLIEAAKKEAAAQTAKVPRTLKAAVRLYRELTGVEPPAGFEDWFDWCLDNGVTPWPHMTAYKTMEPYLSIPGSLLRTRLHELDDRVQTAVFTVKNGEIDDVQGSASEDPRTDDLALLLEPLVHLLPDMDIYFNTDDAPSRTIKHAVLERSLELVRAGEVWPVQERLDKEENQGAAGWKEICSPSSPFIKGDPTTQAPREAKRFIYNLHKTLDHCTNPDNVPLHGTYIFQHYGAHKLVPLISISTTRGNTDVIGASLMGINFTMPYHPWNAKTSSALFWRGTTTGTWHSKTIAWREAQRERLHRMTNAIRGQAEVLVEKEDKGTWSLQTMKVWEANAKWMDIGFTGRPEACEQKDGTCDEMAAEFKFKDRIEAEEALKFRYQFDVDGNGWSSRFKRLLSSGSVILKSTVYQEWFSSTLIPWYHFVPIQVDYSDLFDVMAFFAGTGEPDSSGRPDLAEEIGTNGRQFALERWKWEDIQGYMLLLLLEYNRAMSDDRAAATYPAPRDLRHN